MDALFPPQTIVDDRYIILERMSRGGRAEVYRAGHLHMGRTVALKVVRPGHDAEHEGLCRRFMGEAQIVAQLDHPHIVRLYDMGMVEGLPYVVMELLEGHDAGLEIARKGAMVPGRAIARTLELLSAVAEVHDQGFVHKALSPAALFLLRPDTASERAMLLDFGVAHGGPDSASWAGMDPTRWRYVAPEGVGAEPLTPAFDVYQIALILVELLQGRPVVSSRDADSCIQKHLDGALLVPDWLREGEAGGLLARALARDPGQRWEDGRAFREALLRWCEGAQGTALLSERSPRPAPPEPVEEVGRPQAPSSPKSNLPADFDALFLAATQASLRRAWGEARALFQACQALRPGDARVRHNLGRLQQHFSSE